MIFLTHPLHGSKHAHDEAEAVADVKNGWQRPSLEQPKGSIDPVEYVVEKRRPGRPKKVA